MSSRKWRDRRAEGLQLELKCNGPPKSRAPAMPSAGATWRRSPGQRPQSLGRLSSIRPRSWPAPERGGPRQSRPAPGKEQGLVLQPVWIPSGGEGGCRVFPHGPQAESPPGVKEDPPDPHGPRVRPDTPGDRSGKRPVRSRAGRKAQGDGLVEPLDVTSHKGGPDQGAQAHAAEHEGQAARQLVGLREMTRKAKTVLNRSPCQASREHPRRVDPVSTVVAKPVTAPMSMTPSIPGSRACALAEYFAQVA